MGITCIKNIKGLAGLSNPQKPLRGAELAGLRVDENAWILIKDNRIHSHGVMASPPADIPAPDEVIDASGRYVLPAWCDSHTHLVFAVSREGEFVDKIKGLSYADIAAKGGGILNSARRLQQVPEDELFELAWVRLQELMRLGTGAIEIKSGYGLTVEAELKMLRVIRRIKEKAPIPVKATFLGAHAYPESYRENHEGYIRLLLGEMLPAIAAEGLADYIDVFCEKGFFSFDDTIRICEAGAKYGLKAKIHANQLNLSGGVQAGVRVGAVSVDHLETMDNETINLLAASGTIGTLLPTAAFFLRMGYQPARQLVDAGCAIALASDFNPGSSPSGNMNFVVSLGCIQMKMLPEEAIQAATINGAFAMEVQEDTGSLVPGKLANLIITKPMPSLAYLAYAFGSNMVDRVMLAGGFIS